MEVRMMEHTWQVVNDQQSADQLIRRMDELLQTTGYLFNYMVVDGVEVYEDVKGYIQERVHDIQHIDIKVATMQHLADQMLSSAEAYLTRALPELVKLIDMFYQGSTEMVWEKFEQLLEALDWILRTIGSFQDSRISYLNKDVYPLREQQLHEKIRLLQDASVNSEMTMIGDLLNYEVQPELQLLLAELRKTMNSEVLSHDLNR